MAISPKQLQAIKEIIALHHQAFVANYVSPEALSQQVLAELKQKGMLDVQVSSIQDAYLYGLVLAQLNHPDSQGLTYPQFIRRVTDQPVPLTQPETHAVAMANAKAAQYIVGLGNRVSAKTGEVIIEADKALRAELRSTIRDTVAEALAERKTVKQIKSDLGHATQDWTRDLDRIAVTEQQFAMQEGFAQHVVKTRGEDAKVAKLSAKDCCPQCAALYLEEGGKPRVFKLSDLEKNGTNVGRSKMEYKATIGPVHPNCFSGTANVLTSKGYRPISGIRPGDFVATHKGRFRAVQAVWCGDYDGPIQQISTSKDGDFSVTPNHLFWCGSAWHPFSSMEAGQNVPHHGIKGMALGVKNDSESSPAQHGKDVRFANVLYGFSAGAVPAAAIHLDGKTFLWEGQVDQEYVHQVPGLRVQTSGDKSVVDRLLQGRFNLTTMGLAHAQDGSGRLFAATDSSVGGIGNSRSLLSRHFGVSFVHPLSAGFQCDARSFEPHSNWYPGGAMLSGNGFDAFSIFNVHPYNFRIGNSYFALQRLLGEWLEKGAQFFRSALQFLRQRPNRSFFFKKLFSEPFNVDVGLVESPFDAPHNSVDTVGQHPKPLGYVFDRQALIPVQIDDLGVSFGIRLGRLGHGDAVVTKTHRIVNAYQHPYSGSVYNLTVDEDESYVVQGVAVHNCSCQLVSIGPHLAFNAKNELVVGKPAPLSPGDATVEEIEDQMEPKSVSSGPVVGPKPLAALKKGIRLNLNGLARGSRHP